MVSYKTKDKCKGTVYILNIKISSRFNGLNTHFKGSAEIRQFPWGTFLSKKEAINYIKKNSKKHLEQAYGAGGPNFKCWVINEVIKATYSIKSLNFYDGEGNEICSVGDMFKNAR